MKYSHIINFMNSNPWAIMPEKLKAILSLIELRAAGLTLTPGEIEARIGAVGDDDGPSETGNVALLSIRGVISHRMNLLSRHSGGASTEMLSKQFRQAIRDPDIGAVVLDIDSPGGGVAGVEEFANEIFDARGEKPIIAIANSLAASAAFWIGSQADEFVAIPSGQVGSIGVLGVHIETSKKNEDEGITATVVSAGKFKAEGNPFERLTDEGRDHLQEMVDERFDAFVRAVARGRGVSLKAVREGFGEGRVIPAKMALEFNMIDSIETLDQVIARANQKKTRRRRSAEGQPIDIAIETSILIDWAEALDLDLSDPKFEFFAEVAEDLETQDGQGFVEQTVIAPKKQWSSLAAAKKWLRDHKRRVDKVDETENTWRFRQRDPDDFVRIRPVCINPGRDAKPDADHCKMISMGGPLKKNRSQVNIEPEEQIAPKADPKFVRRKLELLELEKKS